jgi:hypothetical protein
VRVFRVPYVLLALATTSGLLAEAQARSVVETQQSTAYDLPDGWSVFTWTKETGEATLKNKRTGDVLIVKRYGTGGKPEDYSNSEEVASGRTAFTARSSLRVSSSALSFGKRLRDRGE